MENKTALTELIEWIELGEGGHSTYDILMKATELLKKENEQIVDAYNQGYRDGEMDGVDDRLQPLDIENYDDANKYFTQTYK